MNEKLQRLHIAAILTAAYQPPTGGMDALQCENAKITQFERMYGLIGLLCDTPEGEKVCPTPPSSVPPPLSDPSKMDALLKLIEQAKPLLALIPGVGPVIGNLPPVTLPK